MKIFSFITAALIFLSAQKCTSPTPPGEDSTGVESLYQSYCEGCHGAKASEFYSRDWKYGSGRQEVFNSIKIGYPDEGMPSYDTAFDDDHIWALTDYIMQATQPPSSPSSAHLSRLYHSRDMDYRLETIVDSLDIPWGIAWIDHKTMIITDRTGAIYTWDNVRGISTIQHAISYHSEGQGGLLDIAVDPKMRTDPWIYISYSKPSPEDPALLTTAVSRGKLRDNKVTDVEEIFEAKPYFTTKHHFGSRLTFDREGYLYITVGDRGQRDRNPQYLDNHCGKIHRIHPDGSIPSDNPFVGVEGAMPSIYSYGHRNPQGTALHPSTGQLWEHEHGPKGGDEINTPLAGKNYGWPMISYGINYDGTSFTSLTHMDGMEQPIHYYDPSIAPSGMTFVQGSIYTPWNGDLLLGSLRFRYLHRCVLEGDRVVHEEKLLEDIGRLRDVRQGPDGYLYVAVEDPGRILRIIPIKE